MSSSNRSQSGGGDASTSRRSFVKGGAAAAATGALGALAGCTGGGGGGNGSGGNGSGDNNDSGSNDTGDGGGSSESVTISYVSGQAAENSEIRNFFQKMMGQFEKQNSGVKVDLQPLSYANIKQKLSSTVSAGNAPALAEGGALSLKYFRQGNVPNHEKFFKQTKNFPKNLTSANKQAASFGDKWFAGGALRHTVCQLGIRPKIFSDVGVSNPKKELNTWSKFYEKIDQIDKQKDTIAWEETGAYNDLESYWAEARTAYQNGTDPWIRGDGDGSTVIVSNDDHKDAPKTDGMIKNCVKLANKYSSEKAASRTNEAIPSLMLTDRVASYNYASTHPQAWRSVKPDVKIGWHGGDGGVMALPTPKVDPQYGKKIGISDLEGVQGQHGGHVWAIEQLHSIYDVSDKKQQKAWNLLNFMLTDKDFVMPAWGKYYGATPGYAPLLDDLKKEYDLSQLITQALNELNKYGSQYTSTGASWEVKGFSQIRWNAINKSISKGIAGQLPPEKVPGQVRKQMLSAMGK